MQLCGESWKECHESLYLSHLRRGGGESGTHHASSRACNIPGVIGLNYNPGGVASLEGGKYLENKYQVYPPRKYPGKQRRPAQTSLKFSLCCYSVCHPSVRRELDPHSISL